MLVSDPAAERRSEEKLSKSLKRPQECHCISLHFVAFHVGRLKIPRRGVLAGLPRSLRGVSSHSRLPCGQYRSLPSPSLGPNALLRAHLP